MIEFNNFKTVITKLYALYSESEKYFADLRAVDSNLEEILVELKPVNNLYLTQDILFAELFGEMGDIVWWLYYEWTPNNNDELKYKGTSYIINTLADYFNMIEKVYYSDQQENDDA